MSDQSTTEFATERLQLQSKQQIKKVITMYHIAKRRNGYVLVSPTEYLLKLILNKPTYANSDKEITAICTSITFNARKEARKYLNEAVSVDFVQKSPEVISHLQEILKNRYVYGK